MAYNIGVFDSNDDGSIEHITNKYSSLAEFVGERDEIEKKLLALAKDPLISIGRRSDKDYMYLLIHQTDIEELPPQVNQWVQSNRAKIVLYSGGAIGENGVLQRIEVRRKLEDFFLRVQSNATDPLQTFRVQPLKSILQWSHVYQHEFGNLYAPLDFLSLLYQGGDVSKNVYLKLKKKLQAIIKTSLAVKKNSNKNLDLFKKGEDAFNDIENVEFNSGNSLSIARLVSFPVIHIDDEIDNGWNRIFPEIFGNNYLQADTPDEGLELIRQHGNSNCLVLLDLRMPSAKGNLPDSATGLKLLNDIRKEWPTVPIYIFSANSDYVSYGDAMRQGASGYLVKHARCLESRTDSSLYFELWNSMRSSRIANIKHCIHNAFASIEAHKNFSDLPGEETYNTKRALLDLSQTIDSINFDILVKEDTQTIGKAKYLLIVLYKTLEHYVEQKNDTNKKLLKPFDSWIIVPRKFRNRSSHANYRLDKNRIWPGIREIMLSASFLITQWGELLGDKGWSKKHLDQLADLSLMHEPNERELRGKICDETLVGYGENIISPIREVLGKTAGEGFHIIISTLVVDIIDCKSLNNDSCFSWLKDDSLCPIKYAHVRLTDSVGSTQLTTNVKTSQQTISQKKPTYKDETKVNYHSYKKPIKTLDHIFEDKGGIYYHRLNKFCGQELDLSNKAQFAYLEWYFIKNMQKYPSSYSEELYNQFKKWLSKDKQVICAEVESTTRPQELSPSSYKLSVFALDISTNQGVDDPRNQMGLFAQQADSTWIPRKHTKGIDSLYHEETANVGKMLLKGLRMGTPSLIKDKKVFYISPSTLHFQTPSPPIGIEWVFDGNTIWKFNPRSGNESNALQVLSNGSYLALTLKDAKDSFKTVSDLASQCGLAASGPIECNELGEVGGFPEGTLVDSTKKAFNIEHTTKLLRTALYGIKLKIIDTTNHPDDLKSLQNCIDKSVGKPVWVDKVEDSEAFVAIIKDGLNDTQIASLLSQLNTHNKPYLVVNPGKYTVKTFGIAMGLRSRLSKPLWSLVGRKATRIFFGLDVGTRIGDESILAVSCIDHTGRLRAWCRVGNPGQGTGPERISPKAFQKAIEQIWGKISPEFSEYSADELELVIHRDGNTLENEDEFISILHDIGFTNTIDWVDAVKQGAPIVYGESTKKRGLYVHTNNDSTDQYWNLQTTSTPNKYIRPLIIEKREGDTSLHALAAEVFYLGQCAAHDYLVRQKLPLTTYYADGFSKSGSEFLKFVGYEHLRAM